MKLEEKLSRISLFSYKRCLELNAHDIYRWMEHRDEPDVLDWIAAQAKQLAKELREYDDDDFRSRAYRSKE